MSATTNVRATRFVLRLLFLAEPDPGFDVASLSARTLANEFCLYEECDDFNPERHLACGLHSRATMTGLAKMIAAGEVLAELSHGGVVYARLSPKGVLSPLEWSTPPGWMDDRPELVRWAQHCAIVREQTHRWEAKV